MPLIPWTIFSPYLTIFETSLNFTRISHEERNQITIILINKLDNTRLICKSRIHLKSCGGVSITLMKPDIEIVANLWFCSLKFSYMTNMMLISPMIFFCYFCHCFITFCSLYIYGSFGCCGSYHSCRLYPIFFFLRPKHVESYNTILEIAYEETFEWCMSKLRLDVDLTCLEP